MPSFCLHLLFFFFRFIVIILKYLFDCAGSWLQYMGMFDLCCDLQDFCCSIWDLVPPPEINPRPPALGAQSRSHWTREVPL